jgi:hypothetical protein
MHADKTKTILLLKFVALILCFHVAHPLQRTAHTHSSGWRTG